MGVIYDELLRGSNRTPNKIAVITAENISITYSELCLLVRKRANRLLKLIDFRSGDNCCVAILYRDECEQLITVLALNACNLFIAPINPELIDSQVKLAVESVEANYLLHDLPYELDNLDILSFQCRVEDDRAENEAEVRVESCDYSNFLVTLSSGSTGNPKPIVFSEKAKIMRFMHAKNTYMLNENDVVLCASPFHHSLGQRLTFLPLLLGGTLVFLRKFSKETWYSKVKEAKVSFTIAVSSHLNSLQDDFFEFISKGSDLRALVSSSAFIDDETKERFFAISNFDFYEMYGASEVGTATNLNKNDHVSKRGSVGRACENVIIEIVDEHKKRIETPLSVGEIKIKSNTICEGYFNRDDLNRETFVDGYFYTGDLGYLDGDGYLYFVDRKKDLIITGGSNIYPSDIEGVIRQIEGIIDCCVVGFEDKYLVEVPVAFVITRGSKVEIEQKIRKHVRKNLSPFQRPIGYAFYESFPVNATGKIDKKLLREQAKQKFSSISKKYLALKK